jgi:hypothetical protein
VALSVAILPKRVSGNRLVGKRVRVGSAVVPCNSGIDFDVARCGYNNAIGLPNKPPASARTSGIDHHENPTFTTYLYPLRSYLGR